MKKYNKYQAALRILIKIKRQLNIVVVGANDGKTNDPIYDFSMKMRNATKMLLIEPNKPLLPFLQENYSPHPSHDIANCAIGTEGTLTLYAIKQEFWEQFKPRRAKDWPIYRAATGVTSTIKSNVEKALKSQNLNPDEAIEVLNIPAKELKTLLDELNWKMPIDVLQIDAEGYDDIVIYNSNISDTKPTLILFESHKFSKEKLKSLKQYLHNHRYRSYKVGGDRLAIIQDKNFTCIFLNSIMTIASSIQMLFSVIRKPRIMIKNYIRNRNKEKK